MARMGFLEKAEELDVMIEAERNRLKQVKFVAKSADAYCATADAICCVHLETSLS